MSKNELKFALTCVHEANAIQKITNANIVTCTLNEFRKRLENEEIVKRNKIKWIHFIGHGDAEIYSRQLPLLLVDESGKNIGSSNHSTIVDCLKYYAPNAELISLNACSTSVIAGDLTSGEKAIDHSWAWATPCAGDAAQMFGITFFTHWKLGEKSIVDAQKCAELAVESFERPVERDRSNGMTISEPKYMWGNPTISHKKHYLVLL